MSIFDGNIDQETLIKKLNNYNGISLDITGWNKNQRNELGDWLISNLYKISDSDFPDLDEQVLHIWGMQAKRYLNYYPTLEKCEAIAGRQYHPENIKWIISKKKQLFSDIWS